MTSAIKLSKSDKVFHFFIDASLFLILAILIIPIWSTLTLSFRPNDFIGSALDGMFLAPWKWSTAAYKALLGHRSSSAIANSITFFTASKAAFPAIAEILPC